MSSISSSKKVRGTKKCLSFPPREPVETIIFRPNIEKEKKIKKLKITKIKKRKLIKLLTKKVVLWP